MSSRSIKIITLCQSCISDALRRGRARHDFSQCHPSGCGRRQLWRPAMSRHKIQDELEEYRDRYPIQSCIFDAFRRGRAQRNFSSLGFVDLPVWFRGDLNMRINSLAAKLISKETWLLGPHIHHICMAVAFKRNSRICTWNCGFNSRSTRLVGHDEDNSYGFVKCHCCVC